MLEVGDKVILKRYLGSEIGNKPVRIIQIVRTTKKWAYGIDYKRGFDSDRFPITLTPATPNELAAATSFIQKRDEDRAMTDAIITEHQRQREADPRYKYYSRFMSGNDRWDKLTLEQLEQIHRWLEEVSK